MHSLTQKALEFPSSSTVQFNWELASLEGLEGTRHILPYLPRMLMVMGPRSPQQDVASSNQREEGMQRVDGGNQQLAIHDYQQDRRNTWQERRLKQAEACDNDGLSIPPAFRACIANRGAKQRVLLEVVAVSRDRGVGVSDSVASTTGDVGSRNGSSKNTQKRTARLGKRAAWQQLAPRVNHKLTFEVLKEAAMRAQNRSEMRSRKLPLHSAAAQKALKRQEESEARRARRQEARRIHNQAAERALKRQQEGRQEESEAWKARPHDSQRIHRQAAEQARKRQQEKRARRQAAATKIQATFRSFYCRKTTIVILKKQLRLVERTSEITMTDFDETTHTRKTDLNDSFSCFNLLTQSIHEEPTSGRAKTVDSTHKYSAKKTLSADSSSPSDDDSFRSLGDQVFSPRKNSERIYHSLRNTKCNDTPSMAEDTIKSPHEISFSSLPLTPTKQNNAMIESGHSSCPTIFSTIPDEIPKPPLRKLSPSREFRKSLPLTPESGETVAGVQASIKEERSGPRVNLSSSSLPVTLSPKDDIRVRTSISSFSSYFHDAPAQCPGTRLSFDSRGTSESDKLKVPERKLSPFVEVEKPRDSDDSLVFKKQASQKTSFLGEEESVLPLSPRIPQRKPSFGKESGSLPSPPLRAPLARESASLPSPPLRPPLVEASETDEASSVKRSPRPPRRKASLKSAAKAIASPPLESNERPADFSSREERHPESPQVPKRRSSLVGLTAARETASYPKTQKMSFASLPPNLPCDSGREDSPSIEQSKPTRTPSPRVSARNSLVSVQSEPNEVPSLFSYSNKSRNTNEETKYDQSCAVASAKQSTEFSSCASPVRVRVDKHEDARFSADVNPSHQQHSQTFLSPRSVVNLVANRAEEAQQRRMKALIEAAQQEGSKRLIIKKAASPFL